MVMIMRNSGNVTLEKTSDSMYRVIARKESGKIKECNWFDDLQTANNRFIELAPIVTSNVGRSDDLTGWNTSGRLALVR